MAFTDEVYAVIREGAQRSAAIVVPRLAELFGPRSVVDVGGGEGWWADEFTKHGVERALVLDDTASASSRGLVEFAHFDAVRHAHWPLQETFDLALCFECAEHVPEDTADYLVEFVCAAAPIVVFSAAIPGQGGHGHLNEQWPAYWSRRFKAHGFACTDFLRWQLWDDDRVEPWYRQNLFVFFSDVEAMCERLRREEWSLCDPPAGVVHPVVWEHRRQRP